MGGFADVIIKTFARKFISKSYYTLIEKRQKYAAAYASGSILDIGCGQTFNRFLKGDVTGLDVIQPAAIPANYKKFIHADARLLTENIDRCYNTIIALEVLEHIPNYISFLRSCHTLVKKDGLLILSVPNPLHYSTLLSNIIWPKGSSGAAEMDGKILNDPYYGHINFFFPRLMNRVTDEIGFEQVVFKCLGNIINTTLTAIILFYVYRKR
jgi:SAM-dependent methyltransferase